MAPATYVVEGGLVGHQWRGEALLLCREMPGQGSKSGWVGEQGEQEWDREFSEGKPGKGITFEI
jgi:hypothetical protein